jgi:hypothetical protein
MGTGEINSCTHGGYCDNATSERVKEGQRQVLILDHQVPAKINGPFSSQPPTLESLQHHHNRANFIQNCTTEILLSYRYAIQI